ncbi:MAG: hypothetical protein R3B35_02820 [Gemmatimonadales bacterium]
MMTTFMIPMADRTRSWLMRDFASLVVGRRVHAGDYRRHQIGGKQAKPEADS